MENVLNQYAQKQLSGSGPFTEVEFQSQGAGAYRYARILGGRVQLCYLLASSLQTADLDWLEALLEEEVDATLHTSILSGAAQGRLAVGRTVCACHSVGEKTIRHCIQEEQADSVEAVGRFTAAGTGSGSCTQEIEALIEEEQDLYLNAS